MIQLFRNNGIAAEKQGHPNGWLTKDLLDFDLMGGYNRLHLIACCSYEGVFSSGNFSYIPPLQSDF